VYWVIDKFGEKCYNRRNMHKTKRRYIDLVNRKVDVEMRKKTSMVRYVDYGYDFEQPLFFLHSQLIKEFGETLWS